MEKNNLIGNKIRELRKGKKLTLKELAERISVSITYLSEVERGETGANEKIFTGIFREFGVNLAGIGEAGEERPEKQGLTTTKVVALQEMADSLLDTTTPEFFEFMSIAARAIEEIKKKRESGELSPPDLETKP